MEEKTVKQLREELIALGFDAKAAEGVITKDALLKTIEAVRPKTLTDLDARDPKEEKKVDLDWQTKADTMAKHLEAQPKIRVLIPLEPNEKVGNVKIVRNSHGILEYQYISGAVWSKTFNGYKVTLPKGTYVDVPEQIAENLAKELDRTQNAGKQWAIDRNDPATGRSVREQLS